MGGGWIYLSSMNYAVLFEDGRSNDGDGVEAKAAAEYMRIVESTDTHFCE